MKRLDWCEMKSGIFYQLFESSNGRDAQIETTLPDGNPGIGYAGERSRVIRMWEHFTNRQYIEPKDDEPTQLGWLPITLGPRGPSIY